MTTKELRSWGQCLSYDLENNETHVPARGGYRSFLAYTGHFTRLKGRSFPARNITNIVMRQCRAELLEEGKSEATVNRIKSAVHSVLRFCNEDTRGAFPKPDIFKKLPEPKGRVEWYTKDDVDRIEKCAREVFQRPDVADIATVAAYTGMRQGELLKLRAKDVDFRVNSIFVGGQKPVLTKTGCHETTAWREIPIVPKIQTILERRVDSVSPHIRIFGEEWASKERLLNAFKSVTAFLEFSPSYVFHTLRHSFGVWHCESGTSLRILMDLMGHACYKTTLRYAKASDTARRKAMENFSTDLA